MATTEARKTELPGWFWTALGCMTVLVVGLTVVFFVFQPSGSTGAGPAAPLPAAATTTTLPPSAPAAAPADVQRPPAQGIRVERMAPPPPAIDQVPAATAAKAKSARPVKVARTPAAKPAATAAAKPAAAESEGEANEEELLKPKQRPAATAQDDDGEKE